MQSRMTLHVRLVLYSPFPHSSVYLVKTELVIDNRQLSRELERLGRDLNILALTMDTLKWVT